MCFSGDDEEGNEGSETLSVITDADRVLQVLQNVVLIAIHLASSESKIEIDCWTEIVKIEGLILFTVEFTGSIDVVEKVENMFKVEAGNSQSLSLYISRQICLRLSGDLKFAKTTAEGRHAFIASIRCIHARKVLHSSSQETSANHTS